MANTRRNCAATNKAGNPCRAAPLKGQDHCLAHGNRPDPYRFGSPEWSARAGASDKPRVPNVMEAARALVEAHAMIMLKPYLRALGFEVDDMGDLLLDEQGRPQMGIGAVHVGRDKEGGVFASNVEDLASQVVVVERLLDRLYGKPKQATEISGPDGGPIEQVTRRPDLSGLSADQLAQLEGILGAAASESG